MTFLNQVTKFHAKSLNFMQNLLIYRQLGAWSQNCVGVVGCKILLIGVAKSFAVGCAYAGVILRFGVIKSREEYKPLP